MAVSAQGVLNLVYDQGVDYDPLAVAADIAEHSEGNENGNGSQQNYSLSLYPNPTSKSSTSNFNVSYSINSSFTAGSIKVTNQFGEVKLETLITDAVGEVSFSNAQLPLGLNVVQLIIDGTIVSYKVLNLLP